MDMLVMPSESKRRSRAWLGLALGALLAGWTATAQAFFGFGLIPGIYVPQTYYKFGAVYTRAVVLSPNGKPIWVEYGSDGKEAREIGEATGPLEQAQVMSGDVYRAYLQRLKDARERYPNGEVMTAATYRGTSFKTVDGKAIDKPSLSPSSLTVLVRGEKERFSTKGDELLLLQMPIDSNVTPSSNSKALLLSKEGQILHQGTNSIGFRAGFFGKDGKVDDKNTRDRDAKIYGPLPGVGVTLGSHVTGGYALTDDDGKYKMNYFLPPCPGFFFEYTTPAYLELYYKRFNPRGSSNMPYYLTRPDYDTCNGMGLWSLDAAMVVLTAATPMKQAMDFPIDLMVLDGSAQFGGGVKLGDKTAYSDKTGKRDNYLQQSYDFDGDEKPDQVVPGKKVVKQVDGKPKEVFVKTTLEEAELQGIYLSSSASAGASDGETPPPDFTRLIDIAPDFEDRGLLESISKDDLKDTDIYVFRESNGQLVAERRGLHEDELYKNYSGVDEKSGSFRYTIQLRGSKENYLAMSGRTGEAAFSKWQSAGGFKEEFQKRAANHLKAGETVRIIAINRPTGYIGSVKVELKSAVASGNLLNFAEQRIELAPPNLKVWAERKNKIEKGMTKGELKKQLIGNEGAGLGTDISIAIYTDWRDADGGALPEELADYGFTGRLAKIVAANQLAPEGANSLSQFKIKPGQQVQVIQLPEKVLAKQHLYLQVTGQPENRNPDFSSNGSGSGVLKYRPTHYVPVRVPLNDEEASELSRQAYRKAVKSFPQQTFKKPEPRYEWKYRPEMQFSLYDLTVDQIKRKELASDAGTKIDLNQAAITASDRVIDFLYSLLQSQFAQLDPFDMKGEREMVLAMGGSEVKVKYGPSNTIQFTDLNHLSALQPEDFMSIRLYANNDVSNILWEWAFDNIVLLPAPTPGGETIKVSADDAALVSQGLNAVVLRPNEEKNSQRYSLSWSVSGNGQLEKASDTNVTGTFANSVKLTTKTGNRATVTAKFSEPYVIDPKTATFEIVPGKPHTVTVNAQGRTAISGAGKVTLDILAKDKFGNTVADGTLVEIQGEDIAVSGDAETVNGKVQLVLKGDKEAGEKNYSIKVGDVVEERTLTVDDIKLVVDAPDEIPRGGNVPVTIHAESDTPDLSGVQIQVTALRGAVTNGTLTLGSDNSVRTSLDAGNFVGEGKLIARINDKLFPMSLKVDALSNDLEVSNPLLISSRFGSSTDGQRAETEIVLKGDVGEEVEIDLRDYLSPNLLPAAFWGLYGPSPDGRFLDDEFQREIKLHNATPQGQGVRREDRFIQITTDDGYAGVPYDQALARTDDVGATLSFRPDEGAFGKNLLDYAASGLKAVLTGDGRVKVTAQTQDADIELISQPVSQGQWHRMGVHVVAQKLILQVDDQTFTASLSGPLKKASGQYAAVVGKGFKGAINRFGLFDWTQAPVVTIVGGGGEQGSTRVGSDGKARFRISSNLSNLLALRENPNQGLLVTISRILVAQAVADGEDACALVPTTGAINAAEALLNFVVKCELQKKVRQAEIKVKTANGAWQTTVAYAELGLITSLQNQINALGNTAIYLAKCLDGVVTGSTDNAVSTICDFVASLFLVGDIRDFVIHSYYYYTDNTEKFDYPTYVFAGLGIVSTLAEFTGAGVAVDAALAGGKTASKVLKGSAVISTLVTYLDKKVLNGVSGQKVEALKKVIPMLQIVALVAFEGPALKEFIFSAIQTAKDFEIWTVYAYWMTEEGGLFAQRDPLEMGVESLVGFVVGPAHAAAAGKASELLAVLNKIQKAAGEKGLTKNAGAAFTKVIEELSAVPKGTDLSKLAGKSDELVALMAIYSRVGKEGLTAFRKSPCTPGLCFGGRTVGEFLKDIGDIESYIAKHGNVTPSKMAEVFDQLSGKMLRKDGVEVDAIFAARGGAGTLQVLKRLVDKGEELGLKIKGFEHEVPAVGGTRHYDIQVGTSKGDFYIESKYWNSTNAQDFIANSIDVFRKQDKTLGAPGQLMKDLLGHMTNKGAGKNVRWEFTGTANVDDMLKAALERVSGDKDLKAFIAKSVGEKKWNKDIAESVQKALAEILGGLK
ncbi:hypothetical protein [Pseudomonas tohonis]|uniref:hypothetical protein n=1 Tax=Pseudomonas tohonis TaxID=2725477 RepID=UPI00255B812C|nr:hypothetical protein [Pseudomonas tohonis]